MLVTAAALSFAVSGVWQLLRPGDFFVRLGLSFVVAGVLTAAFGAGYVRRDDMVHYHAWSGTPYDRSGVPDAGAVLTNVGAAVFAGFPLAVIGGILASM